MAKVQSSCRHRDKTLHSHAVTIRQLDGSLYAQVIGRDSIVAQRLANEEEKPSYKAIKLARRTGRIQQEALRRVHRTATATTQPPSTFFVNKESRLVTFRLYTVVFGLPGGNSRMYFNIALDTLVLSRHAQLAYAFARVDLGRLQRISVPEVKIDDSSDSSDYVAVSLSTDCLFQ